MLGSWPQHNTPREQIKNKNPPNHTEMKNRAPADCRKKLQSGWLF
jgi:hypothetical protein